MPNFHYANFHLNDAIQQAVENAPGVVEYRVSGGGHPQGTYRIPQEVALNFISQKRELPTWRRRGHWVSSTVPRELQRYFTFD